MAWGTAPLFLLIDEPYSRLMRGNAPPDHWGWREGKPTPIGSPVLPHNVHPVVYGNIYAKPIIEPKYSIAQRGVPLRNGISSPFKYTSFVPLNRPTFITDHHVIALRSQVESLWAPKFDAHIHLDVDGELFVSSLYSVTHRFATEAYTMGYNAFGDPTSHRIYSFGHGGILTGGHTHVWGAADQPGGSVQWSANLILKDAHGGAISPDVGNYEIVSVTWSYTLTKWFRRVYSQDSMGHFTKDLDAYTQQFHKAIPTTFLWDEVMGYAMDAGALWLHPGNTYEDPGATDGIRLILDKQHTYDWTAQTLIDRENYLRPWFTCGRTHAPLTGPTGITMKLGHGWYDARETSIDIDRGIEYWSEDTIVTGTGYEIDSGIIYGSAGNDPPSGGPEALPGDQWVTSVIGTRLVPTWYVTVRDRNNRVTTHVVTDVEFPNSN